MPPEAQTLLLISVGNTRTRCGVVTGGQLQPSHPFDNTTAPDAGLGSIADCLREADADASELTAIIASVNDPAADRIERALHAGIRGADASETEGGSGGGGGGVPDRILRWGRDLPIPVQHSLDTPAAATPAMVGQDRLLNALAAFSKSRQACIVIDAGTAVTVDFVDGQGLFHGGAIAPGLRAMFASLHATTAALPQLAFSPDLLPAADSPPFGKNTAQAMALGAVSALRGLAHHLIDHYAEFYGAYPRIIATGGDAPLLFENDPLVEHIVPDLTLIGMLAAWRTLQSLDDADEPEQV